MCISCLSCKLIFCCCRFSKAYDGSNLYFINQTICFKSGNYIKCLCEDGQEIVFDVSPMDGLGPIAVHPVRDVIAYSDRKLKPKIYTKFYPNLETLSILEG